MKFADLRAAHAIAMRLGQESITGEYRATMRALARGETLPEPSCREDFWPAALAQVASERGYTRYLEVAP